MKLVLTFFFPMLVLCSFSFCGEVKINPLTKDNPPLKESTVVGIAEFANLENVIAITKENLVNQVKLKEEMSLYRDLYNRYMENTADREMLYKVVIAASNAQKTLMNSNLQHVFSKEFLKELNLFASVAEKRSISRP